MAEVCLVRASSNIPESVNSPPQQNTIYGLIILREAGKQLALIDEIFSIVCGLVLLLRRFQAGHAFPLNHLINQAVVQCRGEDEFTDSTTYLSKVCSINFEPPDIDLCSACHVYMISHRAWIISILFIVNRITWGLN